MKASKLNLVKIVTLVVAIGLGVPVKAQTTSGDIANKGNIVYGTTTTGKSVRVVDNKGTVKYLQVQNGITMLTNTTTGITTTTWQLGGTLTDNTYIDINNNVFALDGLKLESAGAAATNATASDKSSHGGTGTGWTVLIRDESTGELKKILLSDLINVTGGHTVITVAAAAAIKPLSTPQTVDFGATGKLNSEKISVYRNGIKLVAAANTDLAVVAGRDYALDNTGATSKMLFDPATSANDWQFYDGDIVEIGW
jgi:hypothetical protein